MHALSVGSAEPRSALDFTATWADGDVSERQIEVPIASDSKAEEPEFFEVVLESPEGGVAMSFSDGVWYDPKDGLFKMWYLAGAARHTCYATSKDLPTRRSPKCSACRAERCVHASIAPAACCSASSNRYSESRMLHEPM